jgi:hypothetical protein
VQVRHTGIKPRNRANEKREEKPRLADLLLTTVQTIFWKSEWMGGDTHSKFDPTPTNSTVA